MVEMGLVSSPEPVSSTDFLELKSQVQELTQVMQLMVQRQNSSLLRDGWNLLHNQVKNVTSGCENILSSLTWRDSVMIGGLALYGVYRLYQLKPFGSRMVNVVLTPKASKILESARPGSTETKLLKPKCQFLVGSVKENGDYEVHGCGFRIEDCLVLPEHVYSEQDTAMVQVTTNNGTKKFLDLKMLPYPVHLDTDLLMIDMSKNLKELSMMGLSKASICHEFADGGNLVAIVGPKSLGTTGILKWTDDFGIVEYSGTTAGGYSGAPYMKGDQVMGMHMHGGRTNGGVSASMIKATIDYKQEMVPETDLTVDTLRAYSKRQKRVRVDASWHHLDTMRIAIGGRVRIVDRRLFREAFPNEDWEDVGVSTADFKKRGNQMHFNDHPDLNRESVNFQARPRTSMGLNTVGENAVLVTNERQRLMEQLLNCSHMKLKKMVSMLNSIEDQPSGSGQTTPLKQN